MTSLSLALVPLVATVLGGFALRRWQAHASRLKRLAAPLEPAFLERLEAMVPLAHGLPEALRARWLEAVRLFLTDTEIQGCQGLAVDDDLRACVAGHACLLLVGRPDLRPYPDLGTVLLYPSTYVRRDEWALEGGMVVREEGMEFDGESWDRGCVILSVKAVRESMRALDGFNVVLHEFAHQFDALDGVSNGAPPMPRGLQRRWAPAMQAAWERLVEADRRRRRTFLDPYGAESPAEFFAVLTETFLELPWDLELEHPDLFALLAELFGFDPRGWQERPSDLPEAPTSL